MRTTIRRRRRTPARAGKRSAKTARPARRFASRRAVRAASGKARPPMYASARPAARTFARSGGEQPVLSVIIPAMNERRTIRGVIRNAFQIHPNTEVIAVVNGSTDGTAAIAAQCGARLIVHPEPLGHDVGRSIGARAARGEVLLFLDADMVIAASQLRPLVRAVREGVDVALNSYEGPKDKFEVHNVVLAKHALNVILNRSDLGGASLTTVPHALSRRAVETIGASELCVPPVAHAVAAARGLNMQAVHYINVGSRNPRKRKRVRNKDPLEPLIVGDHLEAVQHYISATQQRGQFEDTMRNRSAVR